MREKKAEHFQRSLRILIKKNDQTIIFKPNVNKHSQIWKSTTWKQLSVYPVGLTKTLQEFNMAASTTKTASKKYQPARRKYQPIQVWRCFKISWRKDLCRRVRSSACSLYRKDIRRQVFSCEIIKNTFFIEKRWTTVSERAQDLTKKGPNSNFQWYF